MQLTILVVDAETGETLGHDGQNPWHDMGLAQTQARKLKERYLSWGARYEVEVRDSVTGHLYYVA